MNCKICGVEHEFDLVICAENLQAESATLEALWEVAHRVHSERRTIMVEETTKLCRHRGDAAKCLVDCAMCGHECREHATPFCVGKVAGSKPCNCEEFVDVEEGLKGR